MTLSRLPFFAALFASLALAAPAAAQTSSFTLDTTALKPAAVTGDFSAVTPALAPRALAVLNAEEVAQTGAPSLADLLEAVPGIDVRSRGAVGIQTDLSVRGGTFEQTALWVDGVRWSAPHTGHHLMDLPVDPEDISRVEVFRGGASSALGTGAMTGAVALTAGPATKDGTLLVAESGQNGWLRAKVTTDFGTDLSTATGTVARHRIAVSQTGTNGTLGKGTNTDASILRARYS
ncbi:MAG: TonB-dependent receptor plug domain-containing protein [Flavobacteriales bacterium]|nr:TonB-dependent receptor plug domain-containing protein [Flavobacteriales bacterium]